MVAAWLVSLGCASASTAPPPALPPATVDDAIAGLARNLCGACPEPIAVFPFVERGRGATALGGYLGERLMDAFAAQGRRLVERPRLDTLAREHALSRSGLMDDRTSAEAGNLVGARAVAIGSLTELADHWELIVRIVGAQDGRVIASARVALPADQVRLSTPAEASGSAALAGDWSWRCCRGRWYGTVHLSQDGGRVTGVMRDRTNGAVTPVEGLVDRDRLELRRLGAGWEQRWSLVIDPDGASMRGLIAGLRDPEVVLERAAR